MRQLSAPDRPLWRWLALALSIVMIAGSLAQIHNPKEERRGSALDDEHPVVADAMHDLRVNSPGTVGWHAAHAAIVRHTNNAEQLLRSAHALASHNDGEAVVGALRDEDRFTLGSRIEDMLKDPADAKAVASMDSANLAAAPSLVVSSVGDGLMLVGSRTLFVYGGINEQKMLRLAAVLNAIDNDYTDALWKFMAAQEGAGKEPEVVVEPAPKATTPKKETTTRANDDDPPSPQPPLTKAGDELYGALATIMGMQDGVGATPSDPRAAGPLHIQISSSGGAVFPTMGVLDVIDAMTLPIVTHCMGKAFSAGAVLLMAGDRRLMGPHSFVLFHEARLGAFGPSSDVKQRTRNVELAEDEMIRMLVKRTNMLEKWGDVEEFNALYKDVGKNIEEAYKRINTFIYSAAYSSVAQPAEAEAQFEKNIQRNILAVLKPWYKPAEETSLAEANHHRKLVAAHDRNPQKLVDALLRIATTKDLLEAKLPAAAQRVYDWHTAWQYAGHAFVQPDATIKKDILTEYITSLVHKDKKKWYDEDDHAMQSPAAKRLRTLFATDVFLPAKQCEKLRIITEPPIAHSEMYAERSKRAERLAMDADVGRLKQMGQSSGRYNPTNVAIKY